MLFEQNPLKFAAPKNVIPGAVASLVPKNTPLYVRDAK